MKVQRQWFLTLVALVVLLTPAKILLGQTDQGTITGVVQDPSGAVIGNASVVLTNLDMGQTLKSTSDGSGIYVFSPIKIGNYKVTASAPGFSTTTQTNLHVGIQERLNVVVALKPGAATETVTVTTEAPLMQTQESSVGQTIDTETINSTPLAGRNWVFMAQLSSGTAVGDGARGQGKGDFEANGQRAEENNFILDGVDNNANVVDFYNGASFVAQPPPDALAEFKIQTSSYSAEFGHSAGAVVNASLKSGSNSLHGSGWEYLRNTALDVHDWNPSGKAPIPPYHENQFGATLGGPVLKNRVFLFGDAQANRITFNEQGTLSVPSAKMRLGDLSELLNGSLTGGSPTQLYYQSANAAPVAYANNCMVTSTSCTSNIPGAAVNATALKILNLYPMPNANGSILQNNYIPNRPMSDNTFQWDMRADWNISARDNTYSRYSYWNQVGYKTPPLGPILDGGGFGDDGKQKIYGANYMWSETHVFTQNLTNEARFGFNYLHTGFQHPNASNANFASSVGFGGIPDTEPLIGGLPRVTFNSGILSDFGSPQWSTTDEHENVYQILDNVTMVAGNHTLKAGVSFENIRFSTLQPQNPRGNYNYPSTSNYSSNLTASGGVVSNTGSSVADFLLDKQHDAGLSNEVTNGDQRADNAAYVQDDWRLNTKLTVNFGVRWEFFQPYQDVGGYQAAFVPTAGSLKFNSTTGTGSGTGQYLIPQETWSYAQTIMNKSTYSPNYQTVLTEDGITPVAVSDPHLLKAQHTNFAPRLGIAFSPDAKTAIRAGFGIFYGGLESLGYWPNLGENYPFQFTGTFNPVGNCTANSCPTDGIAVGTGFSSILAAGFASNTVGATMRGAEAAPKTAYTEDFNLSLERSLSNDLGLTVSYVGNTSRHLPVNVDANAPLAIAGSGANSQPFRPFTHSGGSANVVDTAMSDYHSLQTKLEKRMSHGYNMLATYTWAHALDDGNTPLGSSGDNGQQNFNLIPIKNDYSNSAFDTRQRFTFNSSYQVPLGKGRAFLNQSTLADLIIGGWETNATFTAQSGNFFTVFPTGLSGASGTSTRAIKIGNAFSTGGTATVANQTCATSVRTEKQWYNPCAFTNPWDPNGTAHPLSNTTYVTDLKTVLGYAGGRRNQIPGPGFERVNMSLSKSFPTFREQKLDFRADIFNLFNTKALANPGNNGDAGSNPGLITGLRSLGTYQPNSRFMQLSLRYAF